MVSIDYIKSILDNFGITQKEVAEEWTRLRKDGKRKAQSNVFQSMQYEYTDSITFIKAISKLSGIPVEDVINEVSLSKSRDTLIYKVGEPPGKYGTKEIPIYLNKKEVGWRVDFPSEWIHEGINKISKANTISMPPINPNDFLGSGLIPEKEWDSLKNNKVYEIITTNNESHLVRVKNMLSESGSILCSSDNEDKVKFPDYSIDKKDIHQIWEVIFRITWNFPKSNSPESRIDAIEGEISSSKMIIEEIYRELKKGKS